MIGRERALCDGVIKLLQDAVKKKHLWMPVVEDPRGAHFFIAILVDGEPSGRQAKISVEMVETK